MTEILSRKIETPAIKTFMVGIKIIYGGNGTDTGLKAED
jgi:hypothetical protein